MLNQLHTLSLSIHSLVMSLNKTMHIVYLMVPHKILHMCRNLPLGMYIFLNYL